MNRFCAIFVALLASVNCVNASTMRGAEISYAPIAGLSYEFTITTHSDTTSSGPEPYVMLCDITDTFWLANNLILFNGSQVSTYIGTHTFAGPTVFTTCFETSNRVAGVANIPNSINQSIFIESVLVISPFIGPNSSPTFTGSILPLQVGVPAIVNMGAFDADGDSLHYEFIDCASSGGPIPGYQLPSNMTIDAVTGDIVWSTPTQIGEYNVAVKVSEYEDGVFKGSVIRDFQFVVENNPTPVPNPEFRKFTTSINPNPLTDKSIIDFGRDRSNTTFMLFDGVGRMVRHVDAISGQDYVLRKRGLSKGTYFYYLEHANGQIERGKIVVQ